MATDLVEVEQMNNRKYGFKRLQAVLCVTSFFICSMVLAGENVDKTLDVEQDSLIEIEHINGEATIKGWDKNQVRVVGELGEQTQEFRFERSGKSVVIEVEVKKSSKGWGWGSNSDSKDDLTIYVPHNSSVDYHSPNADLSISEVFGTSEIDMINGDLKAVDLRGRINLKTVNGDIRSTDLQGEIKLDSVNGDIKAQHIEGEDIYLNTVNGDIKGSSNALEVNVASVNGDIDLELSDVNDLKANSVNGRIGIDLNLIEGGTVRASTVGGKVELGFQSDVQAKFSLESHAGGSIRNNLTTDSPNKAKYGPRQWLEFSTGNPNAWVDVSTVNGRIEVKERN